MKAIQLLKEYVQLVKAKTQSWRKTKEKRSEKLLWVCTESQCTWVTALLHTAAWQGRWLILWDWMGLKVMICNYQTPIHVILYLETTFFISWQIWGSIFAGDFQQSCDAAVWMVPIKKQKTSLEKQYLETQNNSGRSLFPGLLRRSHQEIAFQPYLEIEIT